MSYLVDLVEKSLATEVEFDNPSIHGYGLMDNTEYLSRCQVDTPDNIVFTVWRIAHQYRHYFGSVLDAGAGDGRFSKMGNYGQYAGYEIDSKRASCENLPKNAKVVRSCAFSDALELCYDLSIGNPPYVRHHDISTAWREKISTWIAERSGEKPSGLSNAYLYFLWLSIITTKADGLTVLVIPFEWVERPAARTLREYIRRNQWALDVYKFDVEPFPGVLTTASITVIDKSKKNAKTSFFAINQDGKIRTLHNATKSNLPPLQYQPRTKPAFAQRGLSPGGQKIFVLTEQQRVEFSLRANIDVIPCITTLRHVEASAEVLDEYLFKTRYVDKGKRCWLIYPSRKMSKSLARYLESVQPSEHDNATCNKRSVWWEYTLPNSPSLIYSSGFRGDRPKALRNKINAIAVGAVCGIHTEAEESSERLITALKSSTIRTEVVAVSRGFTKIEVNQMNTFIQRVLS